MSFRPRPRAATLSVLTLAALLALSGCSADTNPPAPSRAGAGALAALPEPNAQVVALLAPFAAAPLHISAEASSGEDLVARLELSRSPVAPDGSCEFILRVLARSSSEPSGPLRAAELRQIEGRLYSSSWSSSAPLAALPASGASALSALPPPPPATPWVAGAPSGLSLGELLPTLAPAGALASPCRSLDDLSRLLRTPVSLTGTTREAPLDAKLLPAAQRDALVRGYRAADAALLARDRTARLTRLVSLYDRSAAASRAQLPPAAPAALPPSGLDGIFSGPALEDVFAPPSSGLRPLGPYVPSASPAAVADLAELAALSRVEFVLNAEGRLVELAGRDLRPLRDRPAAAHVDRVRIKVLDQLKLDAPAGSDLPG